MPVCSKCGSQPPPEQLMQIKNDIKTLYFCKVCIKGAYNTLSFKIFKNQEERKLLKSIKKFLKYDKTN